MKKLFYIIFLFNLASVQAQDEHKERHHIGISGGITGAFPETKYIPGGHLHYSYLYKIKNLQMGIGTGLEYLIDKHQHIGIDLSFSFFPTEDFEISIAPGIVFINNVKEYATHIELAYSFDIKSIHLGPLIETAVSKDDFHLTLGIHLGFGF
jgi:hypothetical protein